MWRTVTHSLLRDECRVARLAVDGLFRCGRGRGSSVPFLSRRMCIGAGTDLLGHAKTACDRGWRTGPYPGFRCWPSARDTALQRSQIDWLRSGIWHVTKAPARWPMGVLSTAVRQGAKAHARDRLIETAWRSKHRGKAGRIVWGRTAKSCSTSAVISERCLEIHGTPQACRRFAKRSLPGPINQTRGTSGLPPQVTTAEPPSVEGSGG